MRWRRLTGYKSYAMASIALVGVSAASTLFMDRTSMAQQPKTEIKVQADESLDKVEKVLAETLGADHPKVKEIRQRLEQARKDGVKGGAQTLTYRTEVVSGAPVNLTEGGEAKSDVISEDVRGNQTVVVRRTADGNVLQDVLSSAPRELAAFPMLANPKQNIELHKALERYKNKDGSDEDKASAKEKILSLLSEQFDDDMEKRGKQIAELEKKVATLKEQIEKRKEAKQRIIDLRLEVLVNEMEGLGFPGGGQPAGVGALFPTEQRAVVRALAVPGIPGIPAPIPPAPPIPPTPPLNRK